MTVDVDANLAAPGYSRVDRLIGAQIVIFFTVIRVIRVGFKF